MYKILIRYNAEHNLWQQYGTNTSSSTTGSDAVTSFTEFETDDVETLKTELIKLDEKYGFENIKVYKDVTASYSVDIAGEE